MMHSKGHLSEEHATCLNRGEEGVRGSRQSTVGALNLHRAII